MSEQGRAASALAVARADRDDMGSDGRGRERRRWRTASAVGAVALATGVLLWLTLVFWRTGEFDVLEYAGYARAYWANAAGFSALPVEYPPSAIFVFSLALWPSVSPLDGISAALVAFGLWMGAFFVLGFWGAWRLAPGRGALRYAVYLLLGAQGVLLARFDLVPALATLAALWSARRGRFTLAYLLLGIGALIKVYPVVLLPLVAIAQWQAWRRGRMAATAAGPGHEAEKSVSGERRGLLERVAVWFAALGFAGLAGFFLLALLRNPAGALAFIHYAVARPAQVESVPATLGWLGTWVGIPAAHIYAFGADGLAGPLADGAVWWTTPALVVGCLAVYALHLVGRLPIERAFLACVCVVLLTARVFSTQYLIWVLPLAAEAGGQELLWLVIAALTFLDYPLLYPYNHPSTDLDAMRFQALVALRNAALVVATVWLLRPSLAQVTSQMTRLSRRWRVSSRAN